MKICHQCIRPAWIAAFFFLLVPSIIAAQELEPRTFSPAPVGTNFVGLTYARTTGSVDLDPALPIAGVTARFNTAALSYYHAFGLWGRQTTVAAALPYFWGSGSGLLSGVPTSIYRSGLGDTRIRLAFFLVGSPAVGPEEFKKRTAKTVMGASLTVVAPVGQYEPKVLINIGANRWAFKPEIGLSRSLGRWMLEGDLGAWFFMQNSNFLQGQVREQQPIAGVQGHVSYTFRPGMWLSLSGTAYTGGRTIVNGVRNPDLLNNSRVGMTFALPLQHSQALKLAYHRVTTARVGGNFSTASVSYQFRFMTRH